MFSMFKDKLQAVQDNLTTSFRGLRLVEPESPSAVHKLPVDLNAGAELLHKYQTQWQEMHMLSEENALAAQKVDVRIGQLHREVMRQKQTATELTSAMAGIPTLSAKTDSIISQIENVQSLVTAVEESILQLADMVESKELQERQLEIRFQHALHSQQRLAKLDTLRARLSEEHRQKIASYEKQFEKKQKERQDTFGKAFEEDLETYKQTGIVPTIRTPVTSSQSLEEVVLDEDLDALDHMLEE